MHTCTYTPTRTHPHTQLNQKQYHLGHYAVEADAAAARDVVATVLGSPLNIKKPRKITGQRTKRADQAVADAVKAANAFMLGNSFTFGSFWQRSLQNPNYNPITSPAGGTGHGGHETDGVDDNKRAKAQASSKGKEDAAAAASSKKRAPPAGRGANASKPAKEKTSAPVCQVRSDKNTTGVKVTRTDGQHTASFTKINVVTNDSSRWHHQGGRLRSIRGFAQIEETGGRKSG